MPIAGVAHMRAVRALEKAGFRVARQGKHIVMTNGTRIVTIPRHDPVNATRWLRSCAAQACRPMSSVDCCSRSLNMVRSGHGGVIGQGRAGYWFSGWGFFNQYLEEGGCHREAGPFRIDRLEQLPHRRRIQSGGEAGDVAGIASDALMTAHTLNPALR